MFFSLLAVLAAAASPPHDRSDLLKTHKQFEPGIWSSEFETTLVHEWSKVSPTISALSSCWLGSLFGQVSRAAGHASHPVSFALQARNMDTIREIANAVSDPS